MMSLSTRWIKTLALAGDADGANKMRRDGERMIFRSPHPDVHVPDEAFTRYVLDRAEELAAKPAIIDAPTGRVLTYGELASQTRSVAIGIADRGLSKGDVVAICSPNVPEYAIAFNAVATAGGVNTTVNPLSTVDDLVSQFRDSSARFLITIPQLIDKALEVKEQTDIEEVFVFGEAEGATPFASLAIEGPPLEIAIDPSEDLVALPYSSGTTARPKGVMLTHHNLVANVSQCLGVDSLDDDEVVIAVLPFFHIYGMVVVMGAMLRCGVTLVSMPRFDLADFLAALADHHVTRAYLVPPIILSLAKHPLVDDFDLSSLKYICSGAAPLGAEVAQACADRLGCAVVQGYGLTETSPVTHMRPVRYADERLESVGPSVPNTDVCIVDLETGEPLGPDQEGEVWLRGPQVMKGYLNRPDATARMIDEDGWLHSGDIGFVDEDGFLRVVDRAKELIKYKGYQVAPAELEDVLLSHPSVADAAVIPSPDAEAGEVPKAFVVRSGEVEAEDVMLYVSERVAPYKKVRRIEFVDEIPKSPSGKILRRLLVQRERASETETGS
jgi:acyl-CoA synthetase (AMP-forming)/AMP-acid ligase II